MQIDKNRFLDALATAAYQVSAEKLLLTDSFDAPIYPESLVQVVVAQSLVRELHCSRIELEFPTEQIELELCGGKDCRVCARQGRVDLICWHSGLPLAAIEVKDQLAGSDDGLVVDAIRLQQLLSVQHRLLQRFCLSFGGLVAYVGKNSQRYKEYKPFDHQLEPKAKQSIQTIKRNIEAVIDKTRFDISFRDGRCIDSSRDITKPDLYINTEFEDPLSGEEQMTKYLVAVISRKDPAGPATASDEV